MSINGERDFVHGYIKEIPHNTAAHLAVTFPSVLSCSFFDLSPGLASPFSLKTVHRTVFRALEPSKPSKSARAPDEKCTRQLATLIARYFLKSPIDIQHVVMCRKACYIFADLYI